MHIAGKIFLIAFLAVAIRFAGFGSDTLWLVRDGVSPYTIIIPERATTHEKKAAEELQHYVEEIAGVKLPVTTDDGDIRQHEILIGKNRHLESAGIRPAFEELDEDGYHLLTAGDKLVIAGGNEKGSLYGVYRLLEDHLGCRMYTPDDIHVPDRNTIGLPETDLVSNPAFAMRTLYFPAMHRQNFADWHGFDSHKDRIRLWGSWVHTFKDLLPAGEYFEDHPEYFSEIGGKRIEDGQLCLSNPEVTKIMAENLEKAMEKRSRPEYFSVSQNDNYLACQCDACSTLIKQYNSQSGVILSVVNEIAQRFPDKKISTLAYQYSRAAPEGIRPDSNVNIMLCTIECNRSRPIATDSLSESFRKDMDDWCSLTGDILLWDYVVQFRNYISPFPNLRVLQPNIQYFRDQGVNMMFQQGSGHERSEFSELRSYLIAKLLWDPDRDVDSLMNGFLSGYYGPAAPFIRKYIDLMHDELERSGVELSIYGFPKDGFDSYLSPVMIKRYGELFDDAEKAAGNDYKYLERVLEARLPLEYAICDISITNPAGEFSYFLEEDSVRVINPDMVRRLMDFVETADAAGIGQLREGGMQPFSYYDRVMNFVSSGIYYNKSMGKPVTLADSASPKYSGGNPRALTDGLRGLADHNYNWLGFEGNDMEAVIDLGKVMDITSVEARFLQWNRVWIFLPEEVEFLASADGVEYESLETIVHRIPTDAGGVIPGDFNTLPDNLKARYIKVKAKSIGTCPGWHVGAGEPAWMFVDEIIIE